MEVKEVYIDDLETVSKVFCSVFEDEPWNDDWSDKNQLHAYMVDLMGNANSLCFGLFCDGELIGIALGFVRHWYTGCEYNLNEFCVAKKYQNCGNGAFFMSEIEKNIAKKGVKGIFLETEKGIAAYSFYQKHGFEELEKHVCFYKEV